MLYIVRAYEEDGARFDYEYGNLPHAEEHYAHERTAEIWEYNSGKEKLLRRKANGEECEV